MDGLGHGYGAFVERLISDFNTSTDVVTRTNAENSSHHSYPHHHSSYDMGYHNSSAGTFTMNGDSSSSSSSSSSPTSTSIPSISNDYHDVAVISQDGPFHMVSERRAESTPTDLVPEIPNPFPKLSEGGIRSSSDTNFMPEIPNPTQIPRVPENWQGSSRDMNLMSEIPNSNANLIPKILIPNPTRRRGHHRRAHSEISFRISEDLLLEHDQEHEPTFLEPSAISDGTSEDLFSMYANMDNKISSHVSMFSEMQTQMTSPPHMRTASVDERLPHTGPGPGPGGSRHQHSASADGFVQDLFTSEIFEYKKPMPPEKLAELALMDPKRAKRIMANRQSAARSKERKVRHISELERRVQTLQNEATTLSAQINMLQRDTSGLTTENNELRLRLHSMEQQAQLHDALSDALRAEIQRLKGVTGVSKTSNGNANLLQSNCSQFHLPQSQFPQHTGQYRYSNQTQGQTHSPSTTMTE